MSWSGLVKFSIGFFLAIAFLVGAGAATAYYFFIKLSTLPPKPIFAEELPKKPTAKAKNSRAAKSKSPSSAQSDTEQSKSEKAPIPLEPGAYKGRVRWREGLSLRSQPNMEGDRIGGIAYNELVVVLEESSDKRWQRVRLDNSEEKGWVRAGNIEKVDAENTERGNSEAAR